jgi:hypothetical protein
MKGKLIWSIFWALVGAFVVVLGTIFIGVPIFGRLQMSPLFGAIFGGAIALFGLGVVGLGVTLLVLTVKAKVRGILKKFFLLTGASAAGLPVFAVLHNLVYGLLIYFFGANFWARTGGDEPVFFILAITVCPIAFLVGAIGSIVLFSRKPWVVPKSPSRRR